jgi:hypothetical protein
MIRALYDKFLDDPNVYRACERYWNDLTSHIAESLGQCEQWTLWIPRRWANGTPMELDGNPMFDRRNEKLDRAFRIIQHPPTNDEIQIAAWLNSGEGEELPRHELVISIALSEESAQITEDLLRKWMNPETTPEDIQSFITDRIEPHYRQSSAS